ncbi:DMT family transporter [Patescibacteria group bacterium]
MSTQALATIFSLATMVLWGIENAISKKYSEKIESSSLMLYRGGFTIPITLISLYVYRSTANFNLQYILIGFVISALSYFGYYLLLEGYKRGSVGVISPISSARILIAVLIGYTFLGDDASLMEIISIFIIFTGVFLSSIDFKSFKTSALFKKESGVSFALLSALVWGISFPLFSIPSSVLGAFLFASVLEVTTPSISILKQGLKGKLRVSKEEFKDNIRGIAAIGIFGGLGSVFVNLGYSTKEVAIVSSVSGSVPLVALLYSKVFYKEKLTTLQQISAALIIFGVVGLSFLSNRE